MKSTHRLFIGTTLCLTVLLGGCGQPGPLYLPKSAAAKAAKSGEAGKNGAVPTPVPTTSPTPVPTPVVQPPAQPLIQSPVPPIQPPVQP